MTKNEKQILLKAVAGQFCSAGMVFTSVEVANHLKRLGVWIRNRHVAQFLNDNVVELGAEFGIDYRKSTINVDSFGSYGTYYNVATLYHRVGFDVDSYNSRDLVAINPGKFESIHGFSPFDDLENIETKPKPRVKKKGKVGFNFPCGK